MHACHIASSVEKIVIGFAMRKHATGHNPSQDKKQVAVSLRSSVIRLIRSDLKDSHPRQKNNPQQSKSPTSKKRDAAQKQPVARTRREVSALVSLLFPREQLLRKSFHCTRLMRCFRQTTQ